MINTITWKKLIAASVAFCFLETNSFGQHNHADYPIQPVAFTQVHLTEHFCAPKIRVNAEVTIPYTLQQCQRTGRVDNFLRAAVLLAGDKLTEFTFDDTDI